jgi:hypothetical protein
MEDQAVTETLRLAGQLLLKLYPTDRLMLRPALEGWQALRASVRQLSGLRLVQGLEAIVDVASLWLKDELLAFTEEDYNEHVCACFCNIFSLV